MQTEISSAPKPTPARLKGILEHVRRMALGLSARVPRSIELEDLIGAGNLGVADALARYPGEESGCLEAFCMARARGAMLDELRSRDCLPRGVRKRVRRVEQASRRLTQKLGRKPELVELAVSAGMSAEQAEKLLTVAAANDNLPLSATDDREAGQILEDASESPEALLQARSAHAHLLKSLSALPPRHKAVLRMSFQEEMPLHRIGSVLGVTESRVSQIRSEALRLLRESYDQEPKTAA
jgi:RNA polymerase sigma factor for flagellar operon FliA